MMMINDDAQFPSRYFKDAIQFEFSGTERKLRKMKSWTDLR